MQTKTKWLIQIASTLLFSCLLFSTTHGQINNATLSKIYFQAATGASSRNGSSGDLAIQGVFKNKWITTLSYQTINIDPKNLPEDYDPGESIIFFIPIKGQPPSVDMKLISMTAGKYFRAGQNSWFTTEAGLSFVRGKEQIFSKNTGDLSTLNLGFVGGRPSNYYSTAEKKTSMGAMLKADFNWAFASFVGLGAGVFANFNSIQSPVGFQLKLMVGKLNREKKSR